MFRAILGMEETTGPGLSLITKDGWPVAILEEENGEGNIYLYDKSNNVKFSK
jgi:hypothetical protein